MNSLASRRPVRQVIPPPNPGHTGAMPDRRSLPPLVRDMPVLYKLLWKHLEDAPGEVRVAEVAQELGLSVPKTSTALKYMAELGAIIDLGPVMPEMPTRGRPTRAYRVATLAELERAQPYRALPERMPTTAEQG
ncbi:hypothetical protein [Deinococcus sp.]|uniref:hypothetical protein n=1 Tax=Deinococcus sp. TaxID=47478 RepID=UPI003B5B7DAB